MLWFLLRLIGYAWHMARVRIKRVYLPAEKEDGTRILVDRLWPRGLTKEKARIDLWLKEIAPSTDLREWFGHEPAKWSEFQTRYLAELHKNKEQLIRLREEAAKGPATLLFAAKDEQHNEAVLLQRLLTSAP